MALGARLTETVPVTAAVETEFSTTLRHLKTHELAFLAAELNADERHGDTGGAVVPGIAPVLQLGQHPTVGRLLHDLEIEEVHRFFHAQGQVDPALVRRDLELCRKAHGRQVAAVHAGAKALLSGQRVVAVSNGVELPPQSVEI